MPGPNRPSPERRAARPMRRPAPSGKTPARRRTRLVAGAFTIAVHVAAVAVLLWPRVKPPSAHFEPPPEPIQVALLDTPKPQPPGPPDVTMAAPQAAPAPPMPRVTMRTTTPAIVTPRPDNSDILNDSQLAGAASVGEGGGGGGSCDLAHSVQQALRRDPNVRTAVEGANRQGKAVMLWNGDWVRTGGQDGKGLSAVREAITWEVAFAPEACRHQRMHGLVLMSLADGSTRFAIGSGDWRWSDLLGVNGAPSER